MVVHGLVSVNGRPVNVPSFLVRPGDKIKVRQNEKIAKRVKACLEMLQDRPAAAWLASNRETLEAEVLRLPTKADAGLPVEESLIVELYSK